VKEYTNFAPTDGRFDEPSLPPDFIQGNVIPKLNFGKMSESCRFLQFGNFRPSQTAPLSIDRMQVSTLSDIVFQQIIYGSYDMGAFSSIERAAFVEYGFARRKLGTGTVLDEPLALLAAMEWISQDPTFSFFESLRRHIGKNSPNQNGFEAYLAFHLRKRFERNPRLRDVFTFRDDFAKRSASDLAWQTEEFELVTVTHSEAGNSPLVSVVTPSSGPSSNIGLSAKTGDKVLEWISSNSDKFTFCFPPVNFGPDLAFFIRSKQSQKLLLVLVQAKNYNHVVERPQLIKGVRTVTPAWLWKSKDTSVCLLFYRFYFSRSDLSSITVSNSPGCRLHNVRMRETGTSNPDCLGEHSAWSTGGQCCLPRFAGLRFVAGRPKARTDFRKNTGKERQG
jgi:hypothetical protein